MIAWVAARIDPGHYGERIVFRFPLQHDLGPGPDPGADQPGPADQLPVHAVVAGRLVVVRGNLLVLPMGDVVSLPGADLPAGRPRHQFT